MVISEVSLSNQSLALVLTT